MVEEVIEELKSRLGASFKEAWKAREDRFVVVVEASAVKDAVAWLFDEKGARLSTISAVDLGLDYELIYHLTIGRAYVNLKTKIPKERPVIDSITPIVPGAGFIEREIQDMFGITFQGHPDPRRISLPFEAPEDLRPFKEPMKGPVVETQKPGIEGFIATGLRFPLTFAAKRQRVKLGLSEVIKCTAVDQPSLDEVQRLLRDQGFDQQVGYDWAKKKLRY